ncbi:MAG: bifunctional alpha,alpha-trehalose-phosphate synthase (UDP-forming)/trehalose-phosphatase [Dehalococcoidia bacterium]|nr:bifunctional alpha,alpha-trehalose-phosphate synthase (UDP-forming)/trehalose-phosphatase [Dehalococcoidia bacterium]
MQRVLLVSNRLPVSVEKRRGSLRFERSVGGLATTLGAFCKSRPCVWLGWPGIELEKIKGEEGDIEAGLLSEDCRPIFLTEQDVEDFYRGYCNKTIWPLFHYFPEYTVYSQDFWEAYERVNEVFANAITDVAERGDIIWIHDYHLMLLPKIIRERLPEAAVGFFLHIPFPSFEIFRLLPWRRQVLDGLLGADLIGFHTYDYVWHFLDSVHNLLGYEAAMGQIITADRIIRSDVFPVGIDYAYYSSVAKGSEVQKEISKLREKLGNCKIILSIDRLDYTKGIPQRLEAFSLFLEKHPEHREKLTLVLVTVPSRTKVEQYAQLKKQVDELVGAINGKYGSIGWTPIWYLYRSLPFHSLIALYSMADIALVTPVRDGMNLIAKEYIATKTKGRGVLVLSETAGAARELGEAIIINVNNPDEIMEALAEGLAMPKKEQLERNRIMQKRLQHYDVMRWANEFIDRLLGTRALQDEIGARGLSNEVKSKLVSDFQESQRRLMLLDYDGTLVPFSEKPEKAKPSGEVKRLLKKLAKNPKNEVVLISGRDKYTLEKWFGSLNTGLIAEHGAWTKRKGKEWKMIETLSSDWKEEVRPILELYVDRTPSSFVEEKEFSLAWHYRKASARLGDLRARELVNDLLNLTANLDLQVLEGSKVVEVKNAGINKGRAALQWLSRQEWDFLLAIGDDLTDEDVFKVLPATAWSIKVGFSASAAKFNLGSPSAVGALLKEMMED